MANPKVEVFFGDNSCCTLEFALLGEQHVGQIKTASIENEFSYLLFQSAFATSRFRYVGRPKEDGEGNWGFCEYSDLKCALINLCTMLDQKPNSLWSYKIENPLPVSGVVLPVGFVG